MAVLLLILAAFISPCVERDYVPNLDIWDGESYFTIFGRPDALVALGKLFADMENDYMHPVVLSGYRSYEEQEKIHAGDSVWTLPAGCSQHQLGTAFDIGWVGYGRNSPHNERLYEALRVRGPLYGFEIPYDGSNTLPAEPWHIHYYRPEMEIVEQIEPEPDPPRWLLWNVESWRRRVENTIDEKLGLSSALVLAVIAQESQGFSDVIAADGGLGLMQIMNRPYWGLTDQELLHPQGNIDMGTALLSEEIEKAGGDIRIGLAHYNCGTIGKGNWNCGDYGGFIFADRVLDYWCPWFEFNEADNACAKHTSRIQYRFGALGTGVVPGLRWLDTKSYMPNLLSGSRLMTDHGITQY